MSLPSWWPLQFNTLMIRPKLFMAFAIMIVMTVICGTVGLLFVDRIAANVSVFSDVTSPLLTESTALVDTARRMRSIVVRSVTGGESTIQLPQRLSELHAEGHNHLIALRQLAAQVGIDVRLEEAEQLGNKFVQTLEGMIAAYNREQALSQIAKDRLANFEVKRLDLQAVLLALANRAEGKISKSEDEAKVQVQTGVATVDGLGDLFSDILTETYPVLQSASKLTRVAEQIDDVVKGLLAQTKSDDLRALEQHAKNLFKTINSVLKKLAGRLRDDDGKAELARIQQGFADLEAAFFGTDGLSASQHEAVAARAEIAAGRETVDRIDRMYLGILDEVKRAVSSLNQNTRQNVANGIANSRIIIAGSILFTTLAGLIFGFFFAHRITSPLIQLTNHVVEIRESGAMKALPDTAVLERTDEIGMLSRSFNLMIAELADARRKLLEWSEAEIHTQYERLNAAINSMPQGLCMFDADQKLIVCNSRYAEIYGLKSEYTVPGTPLRIILEHRAENSVTSAEAEYFVADRLAVVAERKPMYIVNELRDGHAVAISLLPLSDGGWISTHEDITERRKAEAQIAYMAHHDALTELPNRVTFHEEMGKALARVARDETVAILCIDLDYFKSVNDTLGHPIGDALLQSVSERLRTCARETDTVARLGGDEFAIVQVGTDQPFGSTALAARIIATVAEPYDLNGHQIVIGASVGISIAPNDGTDPDQLLKNADMALYRAKEDGRSTYRFFEPDMDAKMQARRALELDLRKALALGEFEVFYQPLIKLETSEIVGFEALLRWRHPQRGLVLPENFIPLAEEIGVINPIGAWVLKQACTEAIKWPSHIRVAVNLSPVQFKAGIVALDVAAALGASGLSAHRLELEITETVLLQDTDATISILNQLKDLGVHISMDDFGTGYSSLGYLQKFPFDKIKIDRSFIHDLADRPQSLAIVRAVAGLSSSLGITTTAEGVETEAQLQQLRDEGCTEVQGFLFSEARPAHEIGALLQRLGTAATAAVA